MRLITSLFWVLVALTAFDTISTLIGLESGLGYETNELVIPILNAGWVWFVLFQVFKIALVYGLYAITTKYLPKGIGEVIFIVAIVFHVYLLWYNFEIVFMYFCGD